MKKLLFISLLFCMAISVSVFAQPANDFCSGAISLNSVLSDINSTDCTTIAAGDPPVTTINAALDATDSGPDFGGTACSTQGADLWYSWTATNTGLYWQYQSAGGDPGIRVYSGPCDSLTLVSCLNTFSSGILSGWDVGDDLIIQVHDFGTTVGVELDFCLNAVEAGCTDVFAVNFDVNATVDDGSCYFQDNAICSGAIAYPGSIGMGVCDTVSFDNSNATDNDNDDPTCDTFGIFDSWFTVTVPAGFNGFEFSALNGDPNIAVYDACGGNSLACLGTSGVVGGLTGNTTYLIQIWDDAAGETNLELCLQAAITGCTDSTAVNYDASATTDDGSCIFTPDAICSGASMYPGSVAPSDCSTSLTILDYTLTSDNGDDDPSCDSFGVFDRWFSVMATDSNAVFSSPGGTSPGLAIYDACGGTEIFCDAFIGATDVITLTGLTAGTTYYLQLWDGANTEDSVDVCLEFGTLGCSDPTAINYEPGSTLNDGSCWYDTNGFCDDAYVATISGTCNTFTQLATEAGGASLGGPCFAVGSSLNNQSAWWTFTAPADGLIDISSTIDTLLPDTEVLLFEGTCALDTTAICAGENDDGGAGFTSHLVGIEVTAGTSYIIEWTDEWAPIGHEWYLQFIANPGVVVANVGENDAVLTYDGACSNVEYTYQAAGDTIVNTGSTSAGFINLMGLESNTEYEVCVFCDLFGEGAPTACDDSTADSPGTDPFVCTTVLTLSPCDNPGFLPFAGDSTIAISLTSGGSPDNDNTITIEWGAVGFTPGTGSQIGDTTLSAGTFSYTIEGLSCSQSFDIFVRDTCSSIGSVSNWVGPTTVSTNICPGAVCTDAEVLAIGCSEVISGSFIAAGSGGEVATDGDGATWYLYNAVADGILTVSSEIDSLLTDTEVAVHDLGPTGDCSLAANPATAEDDDGGEGFTSVTSLPVTAGHSYAIEWGNQWSEGPFDWFYAFSCTAATIDSTNVTESTAEIWATFPMGINSGTLIFGPAGFNPDSTGTSVPFNGNITLSDLPVCTDFDYYITYPCVGGCETELASGSFMTDCTCDPPVAGAVGVCDSVFTGRFRVEIVIAQFGTILSSGSPEPSYDIIIENASSSETLVGVTDSVAVSTGLYLSGEPVTVTLIGNDDPTCPLVLVDVADANCECTGNQPNLTADECVTAMPLNVQLAECTTYTMGVNNACLTDSDFDAAGTPAATCPSYGGGDAWFSFSIPASGNATISGAPSDCCSFLWYEVYQGNVCDSTLVSTNCSNTSGNDPSGFELTISGTPGDDYFIRAWDSLNDSGPGEFQLCVYEPCGPDVSLVTTCDSDSTFTLDVVVNSLGVGNTSFDLIIDGVDSGIDITATGTTTVPGVSDATGATISLIDPNNPSCGFSGTATEGTCALCFGNIPSNDFCMDATPLTVDAGCDGVSFPYTNECSSGGDPMAGSTEGSCFNGGLSSDVWFSFVAPASGDVTISTDYVGGTLTDSEIALYYGSCGNLVEVACDQDGGIDVIFNSIIVADSLIAGDTYFVQVDRWGTATDGTFCIDVTDNNPVPVCPPTLTLNNMPDPAGLYEADDYIESTSQVNSNSGGAVTYNAGSITGEYISLNIGFDADGTVDFTAENIGCDPSDDVN